MPKHRSKKTDLLSLPTENGFHRVGIENYTTSEIDAIIKNVGLKFAEDKMKTFNNEGEVVFLSSADYLKVNLEKASNIFHFESLKGKTPTPIQLKEYYSDVHKKAMGLLKTLGTPDGSIASMDPNYLKGGYLAAINVKSGDSDLDAQSIFTNTLKEIWDLAEWSKYLAERADRRGKLLVQIGENKLKGNTKDEVFVRFFLCLCEIYEQVYLKKAGSSKSAISNERGDIKKYGPFLRFLKAAIEPHGLSWSKWGMKRFIERRDNGELE